MLGIGLDHRDKLHGQPTDYLRVCLGEMLVLEWPIILCDKDRDTPASVIRIANMCLKFR